MPVDDVQRCSGNGENNSCPRPARDGKGLCPACSLAAHRQRSYESDNDIPDQADATALRIRAAVSSALTTNQIMLLAADPHTNVREMIALRYDLPAEVKTSLSKDAKVGVRMALAMNSPLPQSCVRTLAEDTARAVVYNVVEYQRLPLNLIFRFAQDDNWMMRAYIAGKPETPSDILKMMFRDMIAHYEKLSKVHAQTPDETLWNFDKVLGVHREMPNATDELIQNLAENSNASADLLRGIWQHISQFLIYESEWNIRILQSVARHPNTPYDVLESLIRWQSSGVSRNKFVNAFIAPALANPKLNYELLTAAVEACKVLPSMSVDRSLAPLCDDLLQQPLIDDGLLAQFASKTQHEDLRKILAHSAARGQTVKTVISRHHFLEEDDILGNIENIQLDEQTLSDLSQHHKSYVRQRLLKHPRVTSDLLRNLATDPSDAIRRSVAEHPDTDRSVLLLLMFDPREDVVKAASQNLTA